MNRKETVSEMVDIMRKSKPITDLALCCRLYRAGFGNVNAELTEFADNLKRNVIKGDGDDDFTRGYNCACDELAGHIDEILKKSLRSLEND